MLKMSSQKLAIVTGSNKGIGLAIVEQLCRRLGSGFDVFLTSRDVSRGEAAVKELQTKGVNPKFHQLDVSDNASIKTLAEFVKKNYGGLDILVNNAGIAFLPGSSSLSRGEMAEEMMKTNFWGVLATCDALFPLLRPHARVVTVSSGGSDAELKKATPELQKRLTSGLNLEEVKQLMTEFVEAVKQDRDKELGWNEPEFGFHEYCVSKVGVRLLTYAQAKLMEADPREDVVINSCCPGFVGTDLNAHQGVLSTEQGAETPVYLATLEPNVSKDLIGKHFYEKQVVPWTADAPLVVGEELLKKLKAR